MIVYQQISVAAQEDDATEQGNQAVEDVENDEQEKAEAGEDASKESDKEEVPEEDPLQ